MTKSLMDVLNTPKQPTGTLEEIIKKAQNQIEDIEFVNKFQSCYKKVSLTVEEMKVLLTAITI